jgi:hypothetical protein
MPEYGNPFHRGHVNRQNVPTILKHDDSRGTGLSYQSTMLRLIYGAFLRRLLPIGELADAVE